MTTLLSSFVGQGEAEQLGKVAGELLGPAVEGAVRLQAQGLPEAMLRQASERMAAINAAYARLIKR